MNKKLLGLSFFFVFDYSIIAMDLNENPDYSIDGDDQVVSNLLTADFDNDEYDIDELDNFINAVLTDDADVATIMQTGQRCTGQSVKGAKFSVRCPLCSKVLQSKRQWPSEFFRTVCCHLVQDIASYNSQLCQSINAMSEQSNPQCFKCGAFLLNKVHAFYDIYRHLGSKQHLDEIFKEYGHSVPLAEFPHTIEEIGKYCEEHCVNYKKQPPKNFEIHCQFPACNTIIKVHKISRIKIEYLRHIVRHIINSNGDLKGKISSFSKENKLRCNVSDNCPYLIDQTTIIDHLARHHLEAILEQYPIVTKQAINEYIESMVSQVKEVKINKKLRTITCQLCNKKIGSNQKRLSELKKIYHRHLVADIFKHSEKLEGQPECYLCNKPLKKEQMCHHFATYHLEKILEQRNMTAKQVDTYLNDHGIIVKSGKKRKLDAATHTQSNHNNKEYTDLDGFMEEMDYILTIPRTASLSDKEMEKYLQGL